MPAPSPLHPLLPPWLPPPFLPLPILPGLPARVCSYLSPPPLGTHLPIPPRPPRTSGPPIPRRQHSLPVPAAPSTLSPEGRRAGWGALSLGGGASRDPSAQTIVDDLGPGHLRPPHSRGTSSSPAAFGCAFRVPLRAWLGSWTDSPSLSPGAPSLGALPDLSACRSPQKRRRVSARRRSARFLFLPRESARWTYPGRAAAPGGWAQR